MSGFGIYFQQRPKISSFLVTTEGLVLFPHFFHLIPKGQPRMVLIRLCLWRVGEKPIAVRHPDLDQSLLVHDVGILDDRALEENECGQGVYVAWAESPLCISGHGAVDEVPNRRRVGQIAPGGSNRVGGIEGANTSRQFRPGKYTLPISSIDRK